MRDPLSRSSKKNNNNKNIYFKYTILKCVCYASLLYIAKILSSLSRFKLQSLVKPFFFRY